MTITQEQIKEQVDTFKTNFAGLKKEISKFIVGQEEIIEGVLIVLFARGNVLLEGVPGLGKTMLVRILSRALSLDFSRIQFTPDLMPADIIGTNIVIEDESGKRFFQFQKGPIFGNILLADEINRATPKTQSALLEAMQEHTVTVAGIIHILDEPFLVLATQNPIEMEGTYPLPEAQLDRFLFKLNVQFPNIDELREILKRTTTGMKIEILPVLKREQIIDMQNLVPLVPISADVIDYILRIIIALHPESEKAHPLTKQYIRYGPSPRGAQAITLAGKIKALLAGRFNVSFEDIKQVVLASLRHRIILNFEGEAERIIQDDLIEKIVNDLPLSNEEV